MRRTSDIWKISREEFLDRILKSNSVGELLETFGINNKGSNYKTINRRCEEESLAGELIDLKIRGKIKNSMLLRNRATDVKKPLNSILVENSNINRSSVKRRIIDEKILENKCSVCELSPKWNGKTLVLVLDHINGVSNDYRVENLRLVCPNCNSQLDTFAGRNHHRKIKKCKNCENNVPKFYREFCDICLKEFRKGSSDAKRKFNPTKEELTKLVWERPTTEVGKIFGVSDSAVARRCHLMGIEKPPRGYWTKIRSKAQ